MAAVSKDLSTGTLRGVVAYCVETFGPEEAPSIAKSTDPNLRSSPR